MYTSILILLVLFLLVINISRNIVVSIRVLFFSTGIYLCCLTVAVLASIGFFESFNDKYFSVFSNDSFRYLSETKMFSGEYLKVNEFEGVYLNYKSTPKFGLPVLLALFNPFGMADDVALYFLMVILNATVLVVCLSHYHKLFFRKISNLIYYLYGFLLFLFPLDFYWLTRFLREPIAHSLVLLSFLSMYSFLNGSRHSLKWLILSSFLLVFFRPQLIFFPLVFAVIILVDYDFKCARWVFVFYVLTFSYFMVNSVLITSGISSFNMFLSFFGMENSLSIVTFIFKGTFYYEFLFFVWSLFCFKSIKVSATKNICRKSRSVAYLFVLFFVYCILAFDLPIRFIYPFLIGLKILLFYITTFNRPSITKSCVGIS